MVDSSEPLGNSEWLYFVSKLKNTPFLIYFAIHLVQYGQMGHAWQFFNCSHINLLGFTYFLGNIIVIEHFENYLPLFRDPGTQYS